MNEVKLSGRVVGSSRGIKDNGQWVATVLVAVPNPTGGGDTFRVVCYGGLAAVALRHGRDNRVVDVHGRLQSRWVKDAGHTERLVTEVVASGLHFGTPRKQG